MDVAPVVLRSHARILGAGDLGLAAGGAAVNLTSLYDLSVQRDRIDREWRAAIKALAPDHSTRVIAKHAGVSHVTVYKMTKGVTR